MRKTRPSRDGRLMSADAIWCCLAPASCASSPTKSINNYTHWALLVSGLIVVLSMAVYFIQKRSKPRVFNEMLGTSRGFTAEHAPKAVSGPILSPNEPNRTAELAPRHSGGDLPAKRALRNPIVDDREPCRDVEPTQFDHRSSRISTTRLRRHSDDGQQNNGQANGRSQVVGDEISSALSIGSSSVGLLVPERIVSPVGPINAVRSTRSERHKRTPCDEC